MIRFLFYIFGVISICGFALKFAYPSAVYLGWISLYVSAVLLLVGCVGVGNPRDTDD